MQRRYRSALALTTGLMVAATACGGSTTSGSSSATDAAVIVATTSIWADVTGNLACDGLAEIETVIPIGGDPHSFEPSLRDREVLEDADLIVANGLLLEESLEDTIDAAAEHGTPVFRFADQMAPLASDDPEHVNGDPHVWFDPTRVSAALPALRDALVTLGGLDAGRVDACLDDYQAAIAATDADIAALLDTLPPDRRKLVTNHEALGYFADHYGFDVLGAVIPSPSTLSEANAADLEALASGSSKRPACRPCSPRPSTRVSRPRPSPKRSVTSRWSRCSPTRSGPAGSGADTYLGLLSTDARLIVDALS